MQLLTREQSRQLDYLAMKTYGIPGATLMGNAGRCIADSVKSTLSSHPNPHIGIICGKGNNGGDGFAAGAELADMGFRVSIYSLPDKEEISGDASQFFQACVKRELPICFGKKIPTKMPHFDLIIDAILGTGFKGELTGDLLLWIQLINGYSCKVVAADIPSGVDANTGSINPEAVYANETVTMQYSKLGLASVLGNRHAGKLIVADIGFPSIVNELSGRKWDLVDDSEIKNILKPLDLEIYKHNQGKVLLVTGSTGMTGAAYLSTMGALRSGAGLTLTCAPKSLHAIYETKITEGMTVPCEDKGKGYFLIDNFDTIAQWFEWCDVIAIGPGLGSAPETEQLVKRLLLESPKPIVLDADGFQPLYQNKNLLNQIKKPLIITPHYGELSRISSVSTRDIKADVMGAIDKIMSQFSGVLVSKNAPSRIIWGNKGVINSTGNPGLATAGTGDVLTGMIASFVAQGYSGNEASILGVFFHGKAGDNIAENTGQRGLIASDLLYELPRVINQYE